GEWTRGLCLRGALELDDGQMPASAVITDREMERDSGLTADESLRRSAWGTTRPPRAGLEARGPIGRAAMVVDLVGSGGAESRVRPVAVVPGAVDGQFLLHDGEAVRDKNQSPGDRVLDGSDAAFDRRDAAVVAEGAEALAAAATAASA